MSKTDSNGALAVAKRGLRRAIYTVPGTQALWVGFNRAIGRAGRPEFTGWGMATDSIPPWQHPERDPLAEQFLSVNAELTARVLDGRFTLSQFTEVQDLERMLRELMWRHYIVFWSARCAAAAAVRSVPSLVECGVCDGLTAYFAMSAVKPVSDFRAVLYDAWEGMKAEYLLESELKAVGSYAHLALDATKRNLQPFAREAVFVKGFIPESFSSARVPDEVIWLHLDLNSSLPTTAALSHLFDRMVPGALILFDDYGWGGYHETKAAVDRFFAGKAGQLLPLPTGQAVFFKR